MSEMPNGRNKEKLPDPVLMDSHMFLIYTDFKNDKFWSHADTKANSEFRSLRINKLQGWTIDKYETMGNSERLESFMEMAAQGFMEIYANNGIFTSEQLQLSSDDAEEGIMHHDEMKQIGPQFIASFALAINQDTYYSNEFSEDFFQIASTGIPQKTGGIVHNELTARKRGSYQFAEQHGETQRVIVDHTLLDMSSGTERRDVIYKSLYALSELCRAEKFNIKNAVFNYLSNIYETNNLPVESIKDVQIAMLEVLDELRLFEAPEYIPLRNQLVKNLLSDGYKKLQQDYSYRVIKNRPRFWFESEAAQEKGIGSNISTPELESATDPIGLSEPNFAPVRKQRKDLTTQIRKNSTQAIAVTGGRARRINNSAQAKQMSDSAIRKMEQRREIPAEIRQINQTESQRLYARQTRVLNESDSLPEIDSFSQEDYTKLDNSLRLIAAVFENDNTLNRKGKICLKALASGEQNDGYRVDWNTQYAREPLVLWLKELEDPDTRTRWLAEAKQNPKALGYLFKSVLCKTLDRSFADRNEFDFLFAELPESHVQSEIYSQLIEKLSAVWAENNQQPDTKPNMFAQMLSIRDTFNQDRLEFEDIPRNVDASDEILPLIYENGYEVLLSHYRLNLHTNDTQRKGTKGRGIYNQKSKKLRNLGLIIDNTSKFWQKHGRKIEYAAGAALAIGSLGLGLDSKYDISGQISDVFSGYASQEVEKGQNIEPGYRKRIPDNLSLESLRNQQPFLLAQVKSSNTETIEDHWFIPSAIFDSEMTEPLNLEEVQPSTRDILDDIDLDQGQIMLHSQIPMDMVDNAQVFRPPRGYQVSEVILIDPQGGKPVVHKDSLGGIRVLFQKGNKLENLGFILKKSDLTELHPGVNLLQEKLSTQDSQSDISVINKKSIEHAKTVAFQLEDSNIKDLLEQLIQEIEAELLTEDNSDSSADPNRISEIVKVYAIKYRILINRSYQYGLDFEVQKNETTPNPCLTAISENNRQGHFCSVAACGVQDFFSSIGLRTFQEFGNNTQNKNNQIWTKWGHVKNIIVLPNGELLEVDMTPPGQPEELNWEIPLNWSEYLNELELARNVGWVGSAATLMLGLSLIERTRRKRKQKTGRQLLEKMGFGDMKLPPRPISENQTTEGQKESAPLHLSPIQQRIFAGIYASLKKHDYEDRSKFLNLANQQIESLASIDFDKYEKLMQWMIDGEYFVNISQELQKEPDIDQEQCFANALVDSYLHKSEGLKDVIPDTLDEMLTSCVKRRRDNPEDRVVDIPQNLKSVFQLTFNTFIQEVDIIDELKHRLGQAGEISKVDEAVEILKRKDFRIIISNQIKNKKDLKNINMLKHLDLALGENKMPWELA